MALAEDRLPAFDALCRRERCPYAVIGRITDDGVLRVSDPLLGGEPVHMPLDVLLGKPPQMTRDVTRRRRAGDGFDAAEADPREALERLLTLPTVADKTFLVTIGDRTVGGLVSRDQMVGPWQVPVADVAVTLSGFTGHTGEAMAMGERAPLALLDAAASGRMAIGEAVTNIAAADVRRLGDVRLSANWMAACGEPGEDAALFDTVRAVGEELCPALGIAIPVGKDSLSMRSAWPEGGGERAVVAPVSLIVSAFAPVADVRRTLTPQLVADAASSLLLVDLGGGRDRLGGSCLAQVYGRLGGAPPDLDDPARLRGFFAAMRGLCDAGIPLAYHDRSDGGIAITVLEMAFAGNTGVELDLGAVASANAALFSEELGALVQVPDARLQEALDAFAAQGLAACVRQVGRPAPGRRVTLRAGGRVCVDEGLDALRALWSDTTWQMQRLRDNPDCADEEQAARLDGDDPGLGWHLTFDPGEDVAAPMIATGVRPRVAVLREQGVNSQVEMAAALVRGGFAAFDLHMTDLLDGQARLDRFDGLIACGGFSYGDVLGAGEGWAKSILFNPRARELFSAWFARAGHLHAGRVQRLPDAVGAQGTHPRRGGLAALRAQPLGAVRGAPVDGRDCRLAVAVLCRDDRVTPADRGLARRGAGGVRGRRGAGGGAAAGGAALRGQPRRRRRALPGQPQRIAGRHCRPDHRRRPRHDHDAAPGAGLSQRAELLAAGAGRRGQRLDAHVPQRAALAGLTGRGARRAARGAQDRALSSGVTLWSASSAK